MSLWTTPMTWSAALVTVAQLNTHVRDNQLYLKSRIDGVLTNKSGGNLLAGAVVIFDGNNNSAFTTTTVSRDIRVIGVLAEDTDSNNDGPVDSWGVRQVQVEGTVSRGEALVSGTTGGKAAGNGNYSWTEGVIGFALEGGTDTTISALLVLRPQTSQYPAAGYVAAGHDGAVTPECEEFDGTNWTGTTDISAPSRSSHTFRGGGPLFAMGGSDGSSLSDNDEFDPPTWTSRTSLLAATSSLMGGHAGYFGGDIGLHRGDSTTIDNYDVSGDGWSTVGVGAVARKTAQSGVADGDLFIFGGYYSTATYVSSTDKYDFAGSITTSTVMPGPMGSGHGGAIDGSVVISIGGLSAASTYRDYCYAFDPATWSTKTASGTNRSAHAAFDIGSMYYIAYGAAGSYITTCQEYDYYGDAYAAKSDPPSPTRQYTAGGSI